MAQVWPLLNHDERTSDKTKNLHELVYDSAVISLF